MKKEIICTAISVCLTLASPLLLPATAVYHVTVLGIADGRTTIQVEHPTGMNRWGQVIGTYGGGLSGGTHAVLWTPKTANDGSSTGMLFSIESSPGLPPGTVGTTPTGLNDRGQVVGSASTPGQGDGNQLQSWLWMPTALNSTKGVLHGNSGSAVTFPLVSIPGLGSSSEQNQLINNKGAIAAMGISSRPLLWTPAIPNGKVGTWAFDAIHGAPLLAFNDAGQIAGWTCQSAVLNGPYLHTGIFPPLLDSDVLTSPLWIPPSSLQCVGNAAGLNAKGHLAISAVSSTSNTIFAYLYKNGAAKNISMGLASHARAINVYDQVVGFADTDKRRATLFQNGTALDLNTLNDAAAGSIYLRETVSINDSGQILATGGSASFLLTPNALVVNPVLVTKSPMVISGTAYSQTVTVRNQGTTPIVGPISVALDGLTAGVTLTNKAGTTVYTRPGSVYANVSPSDLAPGATTAEFSLAFANPKLKTVNYTARVLGTAAPR